MPEDSYIPVGPDSVAMYKLREMFATSKSFQDRTGLDQIGLFDRCRFTVNENEVIPAPYYIIGIIDSSQNLVAGGQKSEFVPGGRIGVELVVGPNPRMKTDNDMRLEAQDFFASVLADVIQLADSDNVESVFGESYLNITNVATLGFWETPEITQPTTGKVYGALYAFEWGPHTV